MRALALLAWRRTGSRADAQDNVQAAPDDPGGIDDGLAIAGDPRREAAWARFADRPLDTPRDTRDRDGEASDELGLPSIAPRLGKES